MICAGICLAVHFGLWITSLKFTSVAASVVLVTASPVFLAIASRLLFHQQLSRLAVGGIVISLGGAAIISLGNWQLGEQDFTGAMLALGGALAISGYLLAGQRLRVKVAMLTYNTMVFSTAAICLLAVVLMCGYPLTGYSGKTYLMMALLAVVPQLLGHSTLNWSLRYVPATLVAVAVLGEPAGATLWAFLFLGETPSWLEVAGSILILSGIFLTLQSAARLEAKKRIPNL
jgi:drug/metabolite transporter (DMT)-like permease